MPERSDAVVIYAHQVRPSVARADRTRDQTTHLAHLLGYLGRNRIVGIVARLTVAVASAEVAMLDSSKDVEHRKAFRAGVLQLRRSGGLSRNAPPDSHL